jgi:hypothetical protein
MKTAHLRNNPYVSCNYWDGAEGEILTWRRDD